MPTRQPYASCFIFFPTAQNILKFSQPHKWHICKPHKPTHKPKLAKEPFFANAFLLKRILETDLTLKIIE